jgi:Tfp pilus assembly protein PilF
VTDAAVDAAAGYRSLGARYATTDPVDAEASFRRSLELEPDVASAHAGLAVALCQLARYGEAQSQLERALALDPANDDAGCLWAALMVSHGAVAEALGRYRAALADGGSARLRAGYGDLLARLGFVVDAEAAYRAALADAEDVATRTNLGLVLVARGRLADALAEFERALELDPEAGEAALNRANVLVELGRPEDALTALAALVERPDVRGPALWTTAHVHALDGDERAAEAARRAAVAAAPELAGRCPPSARPQTAPL